MVLYLVILVPLSVYYFNKISIISLLKKKKKIKKRKKLSLRTSILMMSICHFNESFDLILVKIEFLRDDR